MKTQLLLKYIPNRNNTLPPISNPTNEFVAINDPQLLQPTPENDFDVRLTSNPNWRNDIWYNQLRANDYRLVNIDLYEDAPIPLNYAISDISNPETRKTTWSKTIVIPGTKNNNKIFSHIYEISGDSRFNPNLRTQVQILQDGVSVLDGNMQLKNIIKTNDNIIDYEIIITGSFTSLFSSIGNTRLAELDFSEFNHDWTRDNIILSWNGNIVRNGQEFINYNLGINYTFVSVDRDTTTTRLQFILTTLPTDLSVGDFIRIAPNITDRGSQYIKGEWQITNISGNVITINYPYPDSIYGLSIGGTLRKYSHSGIGYVYPMISDGKDIISTAQFLNQDRVPIFPLTNFTPAFFYKTILDKIFAQSDSFYVSNFFNSEYFKRFILTQKKTNYILDSQDIRQREFKVGNITQKVLRISGFDLDDSGSVQGFNSFPNNIATGERYRFPALLAPTQGILFNGTNGIQPFDFSTWRWIVSNSGQYTLQFTSTFQLRAQISDWTILDGYDPAINTSSYEYFWGGLPEGAFNEDVEVTARVMRRSEGLTTILASQKISMTRTDGTLDIPDKVAFNDWYFIEKSFNIRIQDQYLKKDDLVWVEVWQEALLNNDLYGVFTEVEFRPGSGTFDDPPQYIRRARKGIIDLYTTFPEYLEVRANPNIVEGSEIIASNFLPRDMTAKDFLINIIRQFNLYVLPDKDIDKLYYIEPRDDFYNDGSSSGDFTDWTKKVDINSIQITPLGELTAKFYNFENKIDSDFWNTKYSDDTSKGYGNYQKQIENDFLNNESNITTSFGSTPMINLLQDSEIIIPQIVQRDNNNLNKPINSSPRYLFWGGIRPTSSYNTPKFWWLQNLLINENSPITDYYFTYYPYAGTNDSPLDPVHDINWYYTDFVYWNRARWTTENLYNRFWGNFINEISNPSSKILKANLYLTPKDIYNFDFRNIYVINGHYLRLQKIIDYDAAGDGLTSCEFLKLSVGTRFVQKTIELRGLPSYNSNSVIPVRGDYDIPFDFRDRELAGNFTADGLSADASVKINGQNNIVLQNSSNINIRGVENFVGASSKNISIDGNNVYISGGLRNVNIVGTNNLVVDESDVTYVNGVKYKYGVAISKSNVIDGGLNNTFDISPTTTATIIDAEEDSVLNPGTTYENIVDAGLDRILPDIPAYGVNALQSFALANYSGSVLGDLNVNQTLPQLIESRVNPVPYGDENAYFIP